MFAAVKAVWEALSQDPSVVAGLIIAVIALMYSHVHVWLACRARIQDKNEHIKDLIGERNRLQNHLLGMQGQDRKSSSQE